MLCLVKAVGAWAIILFVSINLIGSVVRGFFVVKPEIEAEGAAREIIEHEVKKSIIAEHSITILSIMATVSFIGALTYYWNMALALVAILLMTSRLPDLLWEIKKGRKITKSDPKSVLSYISVAIMFLCLPLAWFALCGA